MIPDLTAVTLGPDPSAQGHPAPDPHHRRTLRGILAVAALLAAFLAVAAALALNAAINRVQLPPLTPETSRVVLDRNGALLRPFATSDGFWRLPAGISDVDPLFLKMLVAYEDRRFDTHRGVDPIGLVRAAWQMLRHGRPVSGASTLTMQVARLLYGRPTRSPAAKARQMLAALALERHLSKSEILGLYLTLAPYGGNLEGIRAASLAYFGHGPRRLTPAEAAFLVALPQSPEARRPDRERAETAAERTPVRSPLSAVRDRVFARAEAMRILTVDDVAAARREPPPDRRRPFPMLAAHAAQRAIAATPAVSVHHLTIDANLQSSLELLASERARSLSPDVSVAVLAADYRTGQILASVGSAGLFEAKRGGFLDMTEAVRSPGSTLKPLIYGLAFESGIVRPETLIEDRPVDFAGYRPENFDRVFHGTVSVRRALQLSLNVPAIQLLDAVGPARLVARMKRAGAHPVLPDLSPPGLAVGLGGVGATLTDLVTIQASIANGGLAVPLTIQPDAAEAHAKPLRVLDERSAWLVGSILAGASGADGVARGDIAFKTGTSYGYRDAWAIGFDGRHVIGVWVGRPDGAPVPGLIGVDAAAPILFDAFARLGPTVALPAPPPGIGALVQASLPAALRRFRSSRAPGLAAAAPPEIVFPPSGGRVDLGIRAGRPSELTLKAARGAPPYRWFADGAPIGASRFGAPLAYAPTGPGFVKFTVVDGHGAAASSTIFVE